MCPQECRAIALIYDNLDKVRSRCISVAVVAAAAVVVAAFIVVVVAAADVVVVVVAVVADGDASRA